VFRSKGGPACEGLELHMADLHYKPLAVPFELIGAIYRATAHAEQAYQPEPWNPMGVSLIGPKHRVNMNGKLIHDAGLSGHGDEMRRHDGASAPPVKNRPRRGRIGFPNLGCDDGLVATRGARIRVLDL